MQDNLRGQDSKDEFDVDFRGSPLKKIAVVIVLGALVVAVMGLIGGIIMSSQSEKNSIIGELSLETDSQGQITQESPTGPAGKHYADYTFRVTRTGMYQIDVQGNNPGTFDPFLLVLRNGRALVNDNDGGEGNNARIQHELTPGTYTVRVTTYDQTKPDQPFQFHVSTARVDDNIATAGF